MKITYVGYFLASTLFLTACLHTEDDAANVSPNQAILTAFNQMEKVSDKGIEIVEQQTNNSAAFSTIDNSLVTDSGSSSTSSSAHSYKPALINTSSPVVNKIQDIKRIFAQAINTYIPPQQNGTARQKSNSDLFDDLDVESASISESEVDQFLTELFNPPTRIGNTVTYTFKTQDICGGDIECITIFSKLKLQLNIISSEAGEISFIVDDTTLTNVSYASDMIAVEVFLQGLKQLEVVFNDTSSEENVLALPETFTGSFKISVTLPTTTSVIFTTSIPEAIDIDGDLENEPFTISIASTSNIFTVTADSETENATLEFGIGALFAKFNSEVDTNIYSLYEINMEALTGMFSLNNADQDNIIATNVGIGDQPFTLDINGDNAMTFEMDSLDFSIDGTESILTLDSALNINFEVFNVHGELGEDTFELANDPTDTTLTGSLSVTAPVNTELLDVESTDFSTDITKVSAGGPLRIIGTGYYQTDITVNENQCLESGEDVNTFADGTNVTNCN